MVKKVIFLDSGPLGNVTNPKRSLISNACSDWLQELIVTGYRIIIPEIIDYEVRRELLRANKTLGLQQLDKLETALEYLPINTAALRLAAEFWAKARQQGQPTAHDDTIDGDMILAGQAAAFGDPNYVIATTNVAHLQRFAKAELWTNISAR